MSVCHDVLRRNCELADTAATDGGWGATDAARLGIRVSTSVAAAGAGHAVHLVVSQEVQRLLSVEGVLQCAVGFIRYTGGRRG